MAGTNAAASPNGIIFGGANKTDDLEENGDANKNTEDKNDDVETIVSRLTSGVLINDDPTLKENKTDKSEDKQLLDADGKPTTREAQIISELSREYRGQDFSDNAFDEEKILEGFVNGDLGTLRESLNGIAQNAYERAVDSVLRLIPDIISQTEQQVLAKVSTNNEGESLWNNFVGQFPDYANHRAAIEPQLKTAIEGGVDREKAFAAVDLIFGNLKKKEVRSITDDGVFAKKGERFNVANL